jgi:hypothetical protein
MGQFKKVGIFLFDGVEVMDFARLYEVFMAAKLSSFYLNQFAKFTNVWGTRKYRQNNR